jgi:lipoprotein-releasing system permease protein
VLEKQEEIAVLKSLGASPEGLRTAFVIAGFVLGAIGTVAGIAIGLLIAVHINELLYAVEWIINAIGWLGATLLSPFTDLAPPNVQLLSGGFYLEQIPITIRLADLLLVSMLSLMLSTAAAWLPARRAGRIRPLEVLRRH